MKRLRTALTVILSFALAVSLFLCQRTRRELRQQFQEVHTLTDANSVLRQSLGDLTVAIAARDQQIDRLYWSCGTQEHARPNSGQIPPTEQSDTGQIGAE